MVTEEDVRRVALSLPGSVERPYNRLPSFRVRSSLFLRIHELPDAFFVRSASVDERNELLKPERGKFFFPPHWGGYRGYRVGPSGFDLDEMTEIVTGSWRLCAPKRLLAASAAEPPPTS